MSFDRIKNEHSSIISVIYRWHRHRRSLKAETCCNFKLPVQVFLLDYDMCVHSYFRRALITMMLWRYIMCYNYFQQDLPAVELNNACVSMFVSISVKFVHCFQNVDNTALSFLQIILVGYLCIAIETTLVFNVNGFEIHAQIWCDHYPKRICCFDPQTIVG